MWRQSKKSLVFSSWINASQDGYNPEHWVSRSFPEGHFDRPIAHPHNGETFLLTPESFSELRRSKVLISKPSPFLLEYLMNDSFSVFEHSDDRIYAQFYIRQLYFVTKIGNSGLDSLSSKAMHWLLNKVSTEEQFDNELSDLAAIEDLRLRTIEKCGLCTISTRELLEIYSENKILEQLLVVNSFSTVDDRKEL